MGAIYLNEFNRVFGYIKMLWTTLKQAIISKGEERRVVGLIEQYRA
jgi:hypothetical protein